MKHIDLSNVIERIPELEQHFGIELNNLFASIFRDDDAGRTNVDFLINGEIRPVSGPSLPSSLQLIASAHDESGRVLGVWREEISSDAFYGFRAFSISGYQTLPPTRVTQIKLYPQGH